MQMALAFAFPPDLDALKDLGLQSGAEAFYGLQPILLGCGLELIERGDAKVLVELQDLFRPQALDRQQFQHAFWDLGAQGLERAMGPALVELDDRLRDRLSNTWDVSQPPFGNDALDRLGLRRQAFGRSPVGSRTVGVAALKRHSLGDLGQQRGDVGGVELAHA